MEREVSVRKLNQQTSAVLKEVVEGHTVTVLSGGKPVAGPGVRASLLSTIRLPGGTRQVTYAGHALYLYSGDTGPGQTSYVGETAFGGRWYAIDASGRTVK